MSLLCSGFNLKYLKRFNERSPHVCFNCMRYYWVIVNEVLDGVASVNLADWVAHVSKDIDQCTYSLCIYSLFSQFWGRDNNDTGSKQRNPMSFAA